MSGSTSRTCNECEVEVRSDITLELDDRIVALGRCKQCGKDYLWVVAWKEPDGTTLKISMEFGVA